jgi:serine/threonine protein kinase
MFGETIESCIRAYDILKEKDIKETAAFARRCLVLDPSKRPSADELLKDPYLSDSDEE